MYIAILGREDKLSLAELEAKFGSGKVRPLSKQAALLDLDKSPAHKDLGGTIKIAKLLEKLDNTDLDKTFLYLEEFIPENIESLKDGKLQLGVSIYGFSPKMPWLLMKMLGLKKIIKDSGRSVRIIPNKQPVLSSAQVLYNKLTDDLGLELLLIRNGKDLILGKTMSVQDIDAYAHRDQERPARDAFVGMLPPKLAQIMINLVHPQQNSVIYDPFCGTGVILQEAHLMGYRIAGSDLEERMIDYTKQNLAWLDKSIKPEFLEAGDASAIKIPEKIGVIVSEMYLGQPLAAEPDEAHLKLLIQENENLLLQALENLSGQINSGTRICLAIPAWRHGRKFVNVLDERIKVDHLEKLGYTFQSFKHVSAEDLIYARPDQIVGRKMLILRRK